MDAWKVKGTFVNETYTNEDKAMDLVLKHPLLELRLTLIQISWIKWVGLKLVGN